MKILVTGSTFNTGIAVIYGLAKKGYKIIGTDERQFPFNIHSRHTEAYYKHAPFFADQFYCDIMSIIQKEQPDVLIPVGGTHHFSFHKEEINKYTRVLVPDYKSFISAFDKKTTHRICNESGIAVPRMFSRLEANQLLRSKNNIRLVIKPGYDVGGARGLSIVNSSEQLESAINKTQNKYDDYIIEEYIPGAASMRAVQLVFNKKNQVVAHFILKKIHQLPVSGGITAYAESTHEWELINFVLPFFEKCPWEGPVEIELIIDERDGTPKLIEINPRFAGSISFAIQCGVNFPHIICMASADNQYIESPPCYNPGVFYINLSCYLKAIAKEFHFTNNKTAFFQQVINELKRQKVSTVPDRRDIIMHLAKAWVEITT